MILTILKSEVPHQRSKEISYQNCIRFDKHELEKEITNSISVEKTLSKNFEVFITIVTNSLNKRALLREPSTVK